MHKVCIIEHLKREGVHVHVHKVMHISSYSQLSHIESAVRPLLGPGEPNTFVCHIKLSVVDSDEDVSQDPRGTTRNVEVNPHEATQAQCGSTS